MDKNKVPFYVKYIQKVEKEVGVIDLIIGLSLGATTCALYWRHAWKNH